MRRPWITTLLLLTLSSVQFILAQDEGYDENPVLAKQPAFARSLPVQILLNGIVLALTCVLFIHLLVTGQYHWPLAPLNYALQVSGVLSLLVSMIATLVVILSQSFADTQQWPYMINYLAKDVPPLTRVGNETEGVMVKTSWTTAELAGWLTMDATTSALVQITHIQFLTLLYPSQLERRLILFLLGPLALLSAAMELLPIHQNQTTVDVADTIRNTCNAALSLLFTAALFLWGFAINPKGAWRTDGGTAAFGGAALSLALVSTALNFLYIPTKDQFLWLPSLIWAVVLWQSFLGWWWWVGGGRGVGEVEDLLRREERRDRKRKARAARRTVRKEKAQALWRNASETLGFARRGHGPGFSGNGVVAVEQVESIEMSDQRSTPTAAPELSSASTTSSPTTDTPPNTLLSRLGATPPLPALSHFYHLLKRAHLAAAHSQALERMRLRRAVYGNEASAGVGGANDGGGGRDTDVVGWGLGSFGLRERERRANELAEERDEEGLVESVREREDGEDEVNGIGGRMRSRGKNGEVPLRSSSGSIWWFGPLRRWRLQDSTAY